MNAVIYARYSSHSQTEQSIEGQLRDCNAYARDKGITVVGTYVDRAMTGRNDNRADFQRMLKDSESHNFEAVIVWKLDRFGRNREEIAFNKVRLRKNGVRLLYAKEGIPDAPEGIILESVLEGLAEYYSANLSQNIMRGMRESALKCQSNGSGRMLGYTVDKNKQYQIDEAEAAIVRRIFELYDSGRAVCEIVKILNDSGYKNTRGNEFKHNNIRLILRNEKYIGTYKWNGIVVENGIPQIIDKELFERVQKRLASQNTISRAAENVDFLLVGKLYCGKCGCTMQGDSGTSKSGRKHYYYSCSAKKHKKNDCKKRSIRKEVLERLIVEYTAKYVLTEEFINVISERIEGMQIDERKSDSTLTYYQSQLMTVETSLKNIMKAVEAGIFNDTVQARMLELQTERDEIRANVERAKITRPIIPSEAIAFQLRKYKDGDVDDVAYRKWIINTLVGRAVLYEDKLIVTYNFTGDDANKTIADIEAAALEAEDMTDFMSKEKCSTSPTVAPPIKTPVLLI